MIERIMLMVILALVLTGCKGKMSYSYLLNNPAVFQEEVNRCQLNRDTSKEASARCEKVLFAAANVQSLMDDMMQDPEKFGQKILDEEEACVNTKQALHQAEQALNQQQASPEAKQVAQDALSKAEKNYHDQHEKVQLLLAVVGMGSPE
jgi:hypothetical protein